MSIGAPKIVHLLTRRKNDSFWLVIPGLIIFIPISLVFICLLLPYTCYSLARILSSARLPFEYGGRFIILILFHFMILSMVWTTIFSTVAFYENGDFVESVNIGFLGDYCDAFWLFWDDLGNDGWFELMLGIGWLLF